MARKALDSRNPEKGGTNLTGHILGDSHHKLVVFRVSFEKGKGKIIRSILKISGRRPGEKD